MKTTKPPRRRAAKTKIFHVTYAVTRCETYQIATTSRKAAEKDNFAFMEGALIETGESRDVRHVCTEETNERSSIAEEVLTQLIRMVETFAPDHESDFAGFGLDHFKAARRAIAKAKGGAQ